MAEVTSYAEGTPCWVDLVTSDAAAARAFYGELFGWQFEIGPEETGYYTMCRVRGHDIAGIAESTDAPTAWTTYLATDDLARTVQRVVEASGKLLMEPMDVMEEGKLAVASDSTGAIFGMWQAGRHIGAGLVNDPGAPSWNEVATRDLETAREFYTRVFDYEWEPVDTGEGGHLYLLIKVGGHPVAGAMEMDDTWPAEIPPSWMAYFAVADVDAAVAAAERLGGIVHVAPTDAPFGRWSLITDPQGAAFTVIRMPDMPSE
jgi:predicted enzyme related to lactoylglutathione lyase